MQHSNEGSDKTTPFHANFFVRVNRWKNQQKRGKLEKMFQKIKKNNRKQSVVEKIMIHTVKKGLETNILQEDNKGFKMLQKMGFSMNQGLGKNGQGIKEPIKIDLDLQDKSGIGVKSWLADPQREVEIKEAEAKL